jgi:dUTPase
LKKEKEMANLVLKKISDGQKPTIVDNKIDLVVDGIRSYYYHSGGNGETLLEYEDSHSNQLSNVIKKDGGLLIQHLERALIGTGIDIISVPEGKRLVVIPVDDFWKNSLYIHPVPVVKENKKAKTKELCIMVVNLSRSNKHIVTGKLLAKLILVEDTKLELA